LKVRGDEQSVTNSGRLFHAGGPATAKALSPSNEQCVAGTTRADDDADHSRQRNVTNKCWASNNRRVSNKRLALVAIQSCQSTSHALYYVISIQTLGTDRQFLFFSFTK